MGLKWYFCFKILKCFKVWTFLEKQVGFFGLKGLNFLSKSISLASLIYNPSQIVSLLNFKKVPNLSENGWYWQYFHRMCLNLCFYSKVSNRLEFGFWMEKSLEYFKNAEFQQKTSNASRNVLMLRSSQNVQNLDFLEEKTFFFAKKLDFFRKTSHFSNFFIECISNFIIAQELSKLSKLVFYLEKKIVCSKKVLASFWKQ